MDVTGKNVFITGSTRGIGEAIALAFAKAGANIFLNGRGEIPAEKINAIKAHGVECVGISGDISDYDKAGEMIKEAEQRWVLSIFWSIMRELRMINLSYVWMQMISKCLDINLTGTFNMTQHVLKENDEKKEKARSSIFQVFQD